MGRDKATLPFGPVESMLGRVARIVGEVVPTTRIVCVAAAGQLLPPLPAGTRIVRDRIPGIGPLAGLATGLAALADEVGAAYLTGCDSPLITPVFIERMFELLGDAPIAAPHDDRRWQPLAGVYRPSVLRTAESLLSAGERSLTALLEASCARRVAFDELRVIDPELQSLTACNTMDDYRAAMNRAGFSVDRRSIDAANPHPSNATPSV